ncbi:hypothetical protein T09_4300 [Trichinella sp. T9]|nr:hypothetical protein T09_4300 [Trichinella sp. T9]
MSDCILSKADVNSDIARDSSNSPGRNDGNVSGNTGCVLDVCEKGTVEGASSRILIDQVSTLYLAARTPTVVRTADEPGGQRKTQQRHPPSVWKQKMRLLTEPRLNSLLLGPLLLDCSGSRGPPVCVQAMAYGENGKKWSVNCLLDSASEKLLIRTDVAEELVLSGTPSAVTVRGVHVLSARVGDSPQRSASRAFAMISFELRCPGHVKSIENPMGSTAATPPSITSIHVLIGFDMYYRVLGRVLRIAGEDDPIAMETIFGGILCGAKARSSAGKQETTMVSTKILGDRFDWGDAGGRNNQDEDVKRKFIESITFDGKRYVGRLLWRAGAVQLPDNGEVAMRRLKALRQQLNRDPEKDQEYSVTTLTVDRQKKWMENQVRQKELARVGRFWRMERDILKQLLDPGPRLQPDLVAVLLRFRRSRIALLRLEDWDVCRLLWQERDCGAPVKVYRITREGFGLTCSPFMAMQVVRQHAQGCGNIDALTDRVLSDTYVDDLATSCDGVDENGQAIILDATQVMRTGEHAEGCRVDAHAFYHQHQLNELKRLVAGHPRPVFEIYDELTSNASTSLETAAHFPTWEQARNNVLQPFEGILTTSGHAAGSATYCRADDNEIRVTFGAGMGRFSLSPVRKICPRIAGYLKCSLLKRMNGVQLEPAKFVCDFETALIPAIQGNFPNTRVQGCFFHFCQAVLRQVKMLMALAFLPVHLVPAGFEIINVGTSGQLEALFQYFQQEWLPATKIKLWNVHGVSVRTNNHLEGWHSRMNKRARKHHLGFYQFLQLILDEQGKTETVVRQIDDGYTHGRGSVRRSAAYGVQQRRVAALTGKLVHNEITVEHFLSEISYHTPEPLRL